MLFEGSGCGHIVMVAVEVHGRTKATQMPSVYTNADWVFIRIKECVNYLMGNADLANVGLSEWDQCRVHTVMAHLECDGIHDGVQSSSGSDPPSKQSHPFTKFPFRGVVG